MGLNELVVFDPSQLIGFSQVQDFLLQVGQTGLKLGDVSRLFGFCSEPIPALSAVGQDGIALFLQALDCLPDLPVEAGIADLVRSVPVAENPLHQISTAYPVPAPDMTVRQDEHDGFFDPARHDSQDVIIDGVGGHGRPSVQDNWIGVNQCHAASDVRQTAKLF
jgi:hypothetical protein